MTKEERLKLLKQIEKDICVCSIESTFLDDAKSCAIRSAIEELEQEPCEHCVSREAVIGLYENYRPSLATHVTEFGDALKALPTVIPERTTITYKDCAEAMLKMWIDNVLTDGQYNKIMDKLNTKHIEDMRGGKE